MDNIKISCTLILLFISTNLFGQSITSVQWYTADGISYSYKVTWSSNLSTNTNCQCGDSRYSNSCSGMTSGYDYTMVAGSSSYTFQGATSYRDRYVTINSVIYYAATKYDYVKYQSIRHTISKTSFKISDKTYLDGATAKSYFSVSTDRNFSSFVPGYSDAQLNNGNGLQYDTVTVSGLSENTKYYIRYRMYYSTGISCATDYNQSNYYYDSVTTTGTPTLKTDVPVTTHQGAKFSAKDIALNGNTNCYLYFQYGKTLPYTNLTIVYAASQTNIKTGINGLDANTLYHYRAVLKYGTSDTVYANDTTFYTGSPLVLTDIDGNNYKCDTIGNKIWMLENLKTTKYKDGTSIPNVSAYTTTNYLALTTHGYSYYNNTASNKDVYGLLYNWYAVNDSRGLAPDGWRVATKQDYDTLAIYANNNGRNLQQWTNTKWTADDGLDSVKISFIGNGFRSGSSGAYAGLKQYSHTWTATNYNTTNAYYLQSIYNSSTITSNNASYKGGYAVRCVKDLGGQTDAPVFINNRPKLQSIMGDK